MEQILQEINQKLEICITIYISSVILTKIMPRLKKIIK